MDILYRYSGTLYPIRVALSLALALALSLARARQAA